MNPHRHVTVEGDARTWHTPILAAAVADALAAGVEEADVGRVVTARGSAFQLDVRVQVHPAGHREERKETLVRNTRHRYHDEDARTVDLTRQTGWWIRRWTFNQRRHAALGDADCAVPANHWAVHVPLVTRRYAAWRGLSHGDLLHCIDEDETFEARRTGDRLECFSCRLGDARVDATWKATRLEIPIHIPHTLDATMLGRPVHRFVSHPVLDDPLITVVGLKRRPASTILELAREWTTLGDAS